MDFQPPLHPALLRRVVEEHTAEWTPADRAAISTALADAVRTGQASTPAEVAHLAAFAAGAISAAHYLTLAQQTGHTEHD